ncbi:MAG: response regulator transcription factor [Ruminococcus sp.]|jgi:two-component system response regulator YesN
MKVIIVDDEKKLCLLIQYLINWEKLGLTIAGVAYNGIDALKMIEEVRPDIVITDIKMPGCDGLELIERVQARKIDVHFIIISGYQDFEYARKAIRYGVRDYLSKPIQEDELEEVLRKVTAERAEMREQEKSVALLKNKVEQQSFRIKRSFLKGLISQEMKDFLQKDIGEINEKYHCDFQPGLFQILYVKPDLPEMEEYDLLYQQMLEKISEICRKELQDQCMELITCENDLGTCVLLNYPEGAFGDFRWRLKHIRVNSANMHEISQDIHVTTGVGRPVRELMYIEQSYLDARSAVLNRIFLGTDKIIGVDEEAPKGSAFKTGEIIDNSFRNQFRERVGMYDSKAVSQLLDQIKERCLKTSGMDGNKIFLTVKELFDLFLLELKKSRSFSQEDEMREKFQKEFYRCTSVEEVFLRTFRLMRKYMEAELEASRQIEIKPVKLVKAYIQEHYTEPIKLEELAELVGFNSAYLSTMFKKETGQTITEYILEVRMEQARELLKQKDIKINDIPEMIGLGDAKYFAKQFKKVSGLTPSQYRKFFG